MNVRIPKYRLHRPTGQALVEIHGRRLYLGKHNSPESREKYRQEIARLMASGPIFPAQATPQRLTIDQLVLVYFQHAKQYYVKNGRSTSEVAGIRVALRRLRSLYGHTWADQFGPKALKTLREAVCQESLSRGYTNASMSRIRRMFRWAAAEELVPASVYHGLSPKCFSTTFRCRRRLGSS